MTPSDLFDFAAIVVRDGLTTETGQETGTVMASNVDEHDGLPYKYTLVFSWGSKAKNSMQKVLDVGNSEKKGRAK